METAITLSSFCLQVSGMLNRRFFWVSAEGGAGGVSSCGVTTVIHHYISWMRRCMKQGDHRLLLIFTLLVTEAVKSK